MPARDRYHDWVKATLMQAGWTISHDPLSLSIGKISVQIDLGLENLIGAEKGTEKIAVEIKSFGNASQITDFYAAFGQYLCYKVALAERERDRNLYLAVPAQLPRLLKIQLKHQEPLMFARCEPQLMLQKLLRCRT